MFRSLLPNIPPFPSFHPLQLLKIIILVQIKSFVSSSTQERYLTVFVFWCLVYFAQHDFQFYTLCLVRISFVPVVENTPLCVHIILFIHSSVVGHRGRFPFLDCCEWCFSEHGSVCVSVTMISFPLDMHPQKWSSWVIW